MSDSPVPPRAGDSGVLGADADEPCPPRRRPWVLAAAVLGSTMAAVDGTVVNIALPVLQQDLGATLVQLQWVVEAYALLLGALILTGGAAGDRFGRRRIFGAGTLIFALASLWCGLAPDMTQLIIARGFQGIGAALLVPGSLSIISAAFPKAERGRAIGTWSAFTALAMALGPLLGGWLIDNASWRWIFFINLPLAGVVLWVLRVYVPESRDRGVGRTDWWGSVLAVVGLGGIVLGLIEGSRLGFAAPSSWPALAVGVVALVGFVAVEAWLRTPMLPLGLFRSGDFAGANLLTLLLYASLGGLIFFFPFVLIQAHGYSATGAGAAFLPLIVLIVVLSRWSGGLVVRVGGRLPLVIGPLIAAIGFGLFALPNDGVYWQSFFPAIVVLGIGMAIVVAPLTTVVMTSLNEDQAGLASGVNNAAARIAALLAIAGFGVLFTATFDAGLTRGVEALSLQPDAQIAILNQLGRLAAVDLTGVGNADAQGAVRLAISAALVDGFRAVAIVAALLAAFSAAAAAVMIGGRPASLER
ncbi:MAG: MFS transporter [Proteobacteria bacterium]|nr:MFS transporter [Pseudomonadota bacterium]MDA1057935.1 MFS transporter [Pseudomonadota bacterium]